MAFVIKGIDSIQQPTYNLRSVDIEATIIFKYVEASKQPKWIYSPCNVIKVNHSAFADRFNTSFLEGFRVCIQPGTVSSYEFDGQTYSLLSINRGQLSVGWRFISGRPNIKHPKDTTQQERQIRLV